jgi:geranylgeranylglycerol-phosphate geranylgeranyltransferase
MSARLPAWLSILRPHNMLASALAVVAGNVIARGSGGNVLVVTAVLAALVTGAGNILNDCFDLEVDRINKPRRPLPSGRLSVRAAVAWYLVISVIATTAATVLVPPSVGALIIAWQVALAFYARWCKRWLVVGNLVVAAISASAFLAGALVANNPYAALIPGVIAFLFVVCREIVKGAEDVEGDRHGNVRTLAVVLGAPRAGTVAAVLMLLLAAFMPVPALAAHYRAPYLLVMELLVAPVLFSGAMRVAASSDRRAFTITSRLLKLGMFLGIAGVALGA